MKRCLAILSLSNIINITKALTDLITSIVALYSAYSYFHRSYLVERSFDINISKQYFNKLEINLANNSRTNIMVEFEGVIPAKNNIIYYRHFGKKRIKIANHMIQYNHGDKNYNPSYIKYFRKLSTIPPHSSINNIIIPLSDIIKIAKIDNTWRNSFINELIYNQKLTFIVLFKDFKRRAIPILITIDPKKNRYHKNTYNFMISKMFCHKTLKKIILRQNEEINKKNIINLIINELKILP